MVKRFLGDTRGAAMVEMTISVALMFMLLLGFVDFGYIFYKWNAANKAVQTGVRLASVSSPVALGLASETSSPSDSNDVGEPVPSGTFKYVCTANSAGVPSCTCNAGACASTGASQAAFDLIYYGDTRRPGMLDFFSELKPEYVRIEYEATGLGYWTRPGGPVPTIRVSLQNVPVQFFFLSGLLGFANFTMPTMVSTATGEDLSTSY